MSHACEEQNSWGICVWSCQLNAAIYFEAVKRWGKTAYENAQRQSGNPLCSPADSEWDDGHDIVIDDDCHVTLL